MTTMLLVLIVGMAAVIACVAIPALESWGPLFLALTGMLAFMLWPGHATPEKQDRRSDRHRKAA